MKLLSLRPALADSKLSVGPKTRISMIVLRVMLTATVVLIGMTSLEAIKQLVLPELALWEPQVSVVIMSALISTLTAFFGLRQYRKVVQELGKWQATVQAQNTELTQANAALETAISERAASQQITERQLQQMTALRNIDMAIAASLDLRVTLGVILDQVQTQLKADAACILLSDQHTQTLKHCVGRGFLTSSLQHVHLRLGQGPAGRVALQRDTVSYPDLSVVESDFPEAAAFAQERFISYVGVPVQAKGQVLGVLEVFQRTPFTPEPHWLDFLEVLAHQAAIAINNGHLLSNLQNANADLQIAYDVTIEGWSRALDLRDKETEGHSVRVTKGTLHLARACGVSEAELLHVRRGALLHDIGKMGIPDGILLKPGPLTEDEWVIMKKHPRLAYELLSPISYLRPALDIPYCHHEKWDGTGYPRGLRGEQIPLAARVFAVVDVWDALRSDRPYRPGWPEEKVLQHIRNSSGTHFDPKVVEAFEKLDMAALTATL